MSKLLTVQAVCGHRSGADDHNDRTVIHACESPERPSGAVRLYQIESPGGEIGTLRFTKTAGDGGLTNEALLAVVLDRLEHFQAGDYPCEENSIAAANIYQALAALKRRAIRRTREMRVQPKTASPVSDPDPELMSIGRVTVTTSQVTVDGCRPLSRDGLADNWKTWNVIESHLRTLVPPVTPEELNLLGSVPRNQAGHNGYRELCSAFGRVG